MIRAVCFNRDVFRRDILDKIVRRTKGMMTGNLITEGPVNCIESFPDGSLCYSFTTPGELAGRQVTDCGCDIERFMDVNSYAYGEEKEAAGQRPV